MLNSKYCLVSSHTTYVRRNNLVTFVGWLHSSSLSFSRQRKYALWHQHFLLISKHMQIRARLCSSRFEIICEIQKTEIKTQCIVFSSKLNLVRNSSICVSVCNVGKLVVVRCLRFFVEDFGFNDYQFHLAAVVRNKRPKVNSNVVYGETL
jgi:hypothetical protein